MWIREKAKWMWQKAKSIWLNEFVAPVKSMRLSYLPPLMIYFAAGVSGLTGVVQSFFITKVLGLTPEFLAVLAYWGGVWWAFKMPIGHSVDLLWRFKSWFVFLGAFLMAVSLGIMVGLTGYMDFMTRFMSAENWFVISFLLAPFSFVLQDIVADAMTAEAVPRFNDDGTPVDEKTLHAGHTDMQLLGRAAILFGGLIVAGAGGWFAQIPASETAVILIKMILSLFFICLLGYIVFRFFYKAGYLAHIANKMRVKGILIIAALAIIPIIMIVLFFWLINLPYSSVTEPLLSGVKPYQMVYTLALAIPLVSVSGVILAWYLKKRKIKRLQASGFSAEEIRSMVSVKTDEKAEVNWWILGGSLVYLVFLIPLGLISLAGRMQAEVMPVFHIPMSFFGDWLTMHSDDVLFLASFTVIGFLIFKLTKELSREDRRTLIGTAIIIFVFRATPSVGAGLNFYYIEILRFSESFMGTLSQIGSIVALAGLFFLRPLMAKKSIVWVFLFLTILGTIFLIPVIGLVNGVHEWLAGFFGSDPFSMARTIALIDTVVESPFGQLAMVPMLAWIAHEAPAKYKATYFALMASFTNLALSASTLGTKYLNSFFVVVKPEYDKLGNLITPGVYTELSTILYVAGGIALLCPIIAILLFAPLRGREAVFYRFKDYLWGKIFKPA